jgi:hypothetical protein
VALDSIDGFEQIAVRPTDPIGQPNTAGATFQNTSNTYDCAIGGLPFFFAVNDKYPYKRETAQYRKQQIDQQKEPGEQTLTGWWLRSQSSFHYGAGIRYEEPVEGDTVNLRFNKSAGVEVFNLGRVDLLPDTEQLYSSTGTGMIVKGGNDGTNDFALIADGSTLTKVIQGSSPVTVTWGGSGTILDLALDGTNYYVANATGIYEGPLTLSSNGTSVFTHPTSATGTVTRVKMNWVKQRLIAGVNNYLFEITPITSFNVANTQLGAYTQNGMSYTENVAIIGTTAVHNFTIGSLVTVASVGSPYNGTWQVIDVPSPTSVALNIVSTVVAFNPTASGTIVLASNNTTPIYAHTNPAWKWTGICEGPNAIYVSGYNSDSSSVYRLSLDTTGAVPLLNKALTAADMPKGEIILALGAYVGKYMVFGTNKGIRIGTIDTSGFVSSGYVTYGPFTVITQGYDPSSGAYLTPSGTDGYVYDLAFNDRYVYCTVSNYIDNGDGTYSSGLIKLDLGKEVATNQVAWATNLRSPLVSGAYLTATATSAAVYGKTSRLMFAVNGHGVYIQTDLTNSHSSGALCSSGYIQTGQIRYLTLEDKHFKYIKARLTNPITGNIKVSSIDPTGAINDLLLITPDFDITQDIATGLENPLESAGFRFTLYPTSNTLSATTFNGYQLKVVPAVAREREIGIPVLMFDYDLDRYNMGVGYDGRAKDTLFALEAIESVGDVIILQDFTSGETVQGVIESLSFVRMSPPDKRFSGFGGVCMVQFRTVNA